MTSIYLDAAPGVNWAGLSDSCLSFCRWMWRFYSQTGVVDAKTDYFAYKQGKCRRQVYRWLAAAEAAGAIRRDGAGTHDREIVPLAEPPKASKKALGRKKDVTQNVTQNVTRPSCIDAVRSDATTVQCEPVALADSGKADSLPSPNIPEEKLQKDLASLGVSFPVAVALAATKPEETAEQLAALPYRQGVKDKAAALVASIRQSWPLPEAFKQAVARKQKEAADAQNRALRAELSKKRESARRDVKSRFSGLPDAARAELLDRAAAALAAELPAAWKVMQNRPSEVRESWIAGRAISMMEGG